MEIMRWARKWEEEADVVTQARGQSYFWRGLRAKRCWQWPPELDEARERFPHNSILEGHSPAHTRFYFIKKKCYWSTVNLQHCVSFKCTAK